MHCFVIFEKRRKKGGKKMMKIIARHVKCFLCASVSHTPYHFHIVRLARRSYNLLIFWEAVRDYI